VRGGDLRAEPPHLRQGGQIGHEPVRLAATALRPQLGDEPVRPPAIAPVREDDVSGADQLEGA